MTDSFPRQYARTRGFSLGLPRAFRIADDGSRVTFLRSRAGDDTVAGLWVLDVATGEERELYHPDAEESVSRDELDRRERAREPQSGVTAYDADANLTLATFAVGASLGVVEVADGSFRTLETVGAPFDARLDPTGARVAYASDGALRVHDLASGSDDVLADDDDPDVRWGVAEFIAAEEMERLRGFWWAPDGTRVLACRVDDRPVGVWHIASPIDPAAAPRAVRYPRAGTANSIVTLHLLGARRRPGRRRRGTATRSSTSSPCRGPTKGRRSRWCSRATSATCRCWRSTSSTARPRSCGPTTTSAGPTSPRACRPGCRAGGCSPWATATTPARC